MSWPGEPRKMLALTMLLALGMQLLPLPVWLAIMRPAFLVLVVLYWCIAAPRAGGILVAWIAGLALDITKGAVLGQHALAVCLVAYIAISFHQRLRNQTMLQQSLFVFAMLALYEVVVWTIDGWTGHAVNSPWRWIHPMLGAALWPIVALALGRTHTAR
ncbi:MAG: rod shape-determining protein MreD [Pseudomonadales bacterium]|nr:rod shape-determining protein MreD [Pseudomonadales bacterium]